MARRPSSVRPSVRLSVNFCANRFFSDRHQTCTRWTPGQRASSVLKVKVKVKGHVIRALFWILGMSCSVIDGLILLNLLNAIGVRWLKRHCIDGSLI